MVRTLIHDPILLARKSENATENDLPVGEDLLETLRAHRETCVGMAANMIGVPKKIIVFTDGTTFYTMYNPVLVKRAEPYQASEGCLSLLGGPRPCKRYRKITVRWQNEAFQIRVKSFCDFTAEIIQHELDHLDGILI